MFIRNKKSDENSSHVGHQYNQGNKEVSVAQPGAPRDMSNTLLSSDKIETGLWFRHVASNLDELNREILKSLGSNW